MDDGGILENEKKAPCLVVLERLTAPMRVFERFACRCDILQSGRILNPQSSILRFSSSLSTPPSSRFFRGSVHQTIKIKSASASPASRMNQIMELEK
jgi:hypothetical protein